LDHFGVVLARDLIVRLFGATGRFSGRLFGGPFGRVDAGGGN